MSGTASPLQRWLAAIACLGVLVCSAPARAEGLSLGWQDCRAAGGAGFANQSFGCQSNTAELPLFPGFLLAAPLDSVISLELVIDVDVDASALPAWWRMDPGQCRAGGWSAGSVDAASCGDVWGGSGVAAVQGWLPGEPGGSPRHARLLVASAAAPGTLATLSANLPYTACRILLRTNNTLTCEGCTTAACMVFNSILFRRLPGSSPEQVTISLPEVPGLERVSWQGGGSADCASVPTRRQTWGMVKSLYR